MSHMKLDEPVRQLHIAHGYYSDAWWEARRAAGLAVPHEAQAVERTDSRAMVPDWRTGVAPAAEQLAEQFNADIPAGGAP